MISPHFSLHVGELSCSALMFYAAIYLGPASEKMHTELSEHGGKPGGGKQIALSVLLFVVDQHFLSSWPGSHT